jgi:hypothetical protein
MGCVRQRAQREPPLPLISAPLSPVRDEFARSTLAQTLAEATPSRAATSRTLGIPTISALPATHSMSSGVSRTHSVADGLLWSQGRIPRCAQTRIAASVIPSRSPTALAGTSPSARQFWGDPCGSDTRWRCHAAAPSRPPWLGSTTSSGGCTSPTQPTRPPPGSQASSWPGAGASLDGGAGPQASWAEAKKTRPAKLAGC